MGRRMIGILILDSEDELVAGSAVVVPASASATPADSVRRNAREQPQQPQGQVTSMRQDLERTKLDVITEEPVLSTDAGLSCPLLSAPWYEALRQTFDEVPLHAHAKLKRAETR